MKTMQVINTILSWTAVGYFAFYLYTEDKNALYIGMQLLGISLILHGTRELYNVCRRILNKNKRYVYFVSYDFNTNNKRGSGAKIIESTERIVTVEVLKTFREDIEKWDKHENVLLKNVQPLPITHLDV